VARYGKSFKDRAVARLLPPESATLELVSQEVGIASGTLQRWRDDIQSIPALGRAWTGPARLQAVITTAALSEADKNAWCRTQGIYPAELEQWCANASTALTEPQDARASPQAIRQDRKRIKDA
jgi:transposase